MPGDFVATEELSHRGLGSKGKENETFTENGLEPAKLRLNNGLKSIDKVLSN